MRIKGKEVPSFLSSEEEEGRVWCVGTGAGDSSQDRRVSCPSLESRFNCG